VRKDQVGFLGQTTCSLVFHSGAICELPTERDTRDAGRNTLWALALKSTISGKQSSAEIRQNGVGEWGIAVAEVGKHTDTATMGQTVSHTALVHSSLESAQGPRLFQKSALVSS
jgi:hypothetical protein